MYLRYLSIFLFCILLTEQKETNKYRSTALENETESTECGQYGFRCIENKFFQVCTFADVDGQTEQPQLIHECHESMVCDEDDPSYCRPSDPVYMAGVRLAESTHVDKVFEKREPFVIHRDYKNLKNTLFKHLIGPNSAIRANTKKKSIENDEQQTSTTEINAPDTNLDLEFICDQHGFFEDNKNKSMFWYCDHKCNGDAGFKLHHMLCTAGRVFDPKHRECVLVGTTRNIRHKNGHKAIESGKNNASADFIVNHTRDRDTICQTEIRFHETTLDCDEYYVCYEDEVVRRKCPKLYRFDQELLICRPEHLVICHQIEL